MKSFLVLQIYTNQIAPGYRLVVLQKGSGRLQDQRGRNNKEHGDMPPPDFFRNWK